MWWVQAILLWNVLGTSHSGMECAGYKPFCYGMCLGAGGFHGVLVW